MPGATSYGSSSSAYGAVFGPGFESTPGFGLPDAFVGALGLRFLFLRKRSNDNEVLKDNEVGKEDVRG